MSQSQIQQLVAAGELAPGVAFRDGFEWVERCDLCGGTRQRRTAVYHEYLLFTGEKFQLVRCEDCGLEFINPRPSPALIGEYYPDHYTPHQEVPRPLRRWQQLAGAPDAPDPGLLRRLHL